MTSLRRSRYQNSCYANQLLFQPKETLTTLKSTVNVQSVREFDTLVQQLSSPTLALFGHGSDPAFAALEANFAAAPPYLRVDTGALPELGARYCVRKPAVFKLYKGHVLRKMQHPSQLKSFTCDAPCVNVRWRPFPY